MSYLASQFSYDTINQGNVRVIEKCEHIPVMLSESILGLKILQNGRYLDATFGRGGHSRAILSHLGEAGILWVLDQDPQAIAVARDLALEDRRVRVLAGRFSQLGDLGGIALEGLDGAMIDFGVSSPQLDDGDRGFSFNKDGPLDMRMNNQAGQTAEVWLSRASVDEISYVLSTYAEEKYAQAIAEKIGEVRELKPLKTTKDLVEVVLASVPTMKSSHHPATKVFQAIRMHINDELREIVAGLAIIADKLKPGGRIITLTYHSLEHRAVSDILKRKVVMPEVSYELTSNLPQIRRVGPAKKPSPEEVRRNSRSRSALLRIWEKKK
jgi:16S rRNA (cytosine1402-N4)-methyltransferase